VALEAAIAHCAGPKRFRRLASQTLLLLLALAIPTLSTVAKNSWYLPQSDPGHYLTIASKMKVAGPPVMLHRGLLEPIARVVPSQPQRGRISRLESEPAVPWISLTVSLQQRSPPASLAKTNL
jgi:hypothetical protein